MTEPVILEAREPRSRFGRVVKWGFWIFQLVMLAVTLGTCATVIPYAGSQDPEVAAGAAMFGAATLGIAWIAWPVGTIVLGILLLATRGRRRLVQLAPEGVMGLPRASGEAVGVPRASGGVVGSQPVSPGAAGLRPPPAADTAIRPGPGMDAPAPRPPPRPGGSVPQTGPAQDSSRGP